MGGWCDQIGRWGRASWGRERAVGGWGLCAFLHRAGCEIRLGVWGGPLGAKRGLWGGWGLCVFLHRA